MTGQEAPGTPGRGLQPNGGYLGFYLFSHIGSLSPPGTALKSFLGLAVEPMGEEMENPRKYPPSIISTGILLIQSFGGGVPGFYVTCNPGPPKD